MSIRHALLLTASPLLLGLAGSSLPRSAAMSVVGGAAVAAASPSRAQDAAREIDTPAERHTHVAATKLPLIVDGERTPDQIPDDVAYRHFVSVTAVPGAASPGDIHRRNSILSGVGLSPEDQAAYVSAASGVRDALNDIDYQMRNARDKAAVADELRAQKRVVLDSAAERIRSSLTVDGLARLQQHIKERVKRKIRIYGSGQ